jgi:nucleotide-binding universal stress UspA family protein
MAAEEARRRGVPLHLLHALDIVPFAERHPPVTAMPYLEGKSWIALAGVDGLRTRAKRRLDETLHDSGLETALVAGSANEVIVRYAESVGAELIVVGTHGRSGLKRLMLGSTASSVTERARALLGLDRATRTSVITLRKGSHGNIQGRISRWQPCDKVNQSDARKGTGHRCAVRAADDGDLVQGTAVV